MQEEADAVSEVLLSNKVNYWMGIERREFEKELTAFAGMQHVVVLSNGMLAPGVMPKTTGIDAGDDIIVTLCISSASVLCTIAADASPVSTDVDLNSQNTSAGAIKVALTSNTKAVTVAHLAGTSVKMDGVMDLAKEHGSWAVEDCAQAYGAKYKGKSISFIGYVGAQLLC